MSLLARTSIVLALSSIALSAHASDGFVPRTPVLWEGVPCVERVDRAQDPVMHLPYDIPNEDTELTPHEVEDSRTHQFVAFCRRKHQLEHLPNWISWADVDAAVEVELLDSADLVNPEDVLESSTVWAGCWSRITQDDERRPIVFAKANEGVDWDTTELEAGAYTVYGYTYHPPLNTWHVRPGVVKVHDADAAAAGPAVATFDLEHSDDIVIYGGAKVSIEGCVDAVSPATARGYYAHVKGIEPNWVPFEEVEVLGDHFSLELVAVDDLVGVTSMIRVDVEDESGKGTTYMDEVVIVLEGTDPNACREDGGGFIGTPGCDDDGEDSTGPQTSGPSSDDDGGETSGGTDDAGPRQGEDPSGCSCSTAIHVPMQWLWPALVFLGFARRRRLGRKG